MRARITLIAAPLVLALAACGGGGDSDDGTAGGASTPPPTAADPAAPDTGPDEDGAAGSPSKDTSGEPGSPERPKEPKAGVTVVESDVGRILADQSGRTLYGFTKDKDGASNCDTDCIAVWPAMISSSKVSAGEGVRKKLLRASEQSQGVTQATYGEWPLYYYVGDAAPGEINGQGLDDEWFVVAPDGKLIKKSD